jgi:uncharacterized membrane protein YeaQ/YmgE (transglycosylase-associated protein family)
MKPTTLSASSWITRFVPAALVATWLAAWCCTALEVRAAESVSDQVGAAASSAEKQISESSRAAEARVQELWRRIDEQRLKNRTPDQLVAWVIMGLLAGGLIHKLSKLGKVTTVLLGLVGAFLGGIVANVTQLDLGMGPVLIRYEDLIFALLGGVILLLVARWLASHRSPKS